MDNIAFNQVCAKCKKMSDLLTRNGQEYICIDCFEKIYGKPVILGEKL